MIPILGMHRSGTSALASALHKLGADLGPESSWISPASDNPLGFFEYEPVVELDRELLVALGGTWSSPPPLPDGWIDDERIADLRERAGQLAAEMSDEMVVKDPRLSLLQPLWDAVAPMRPAVLSLRHPAAVAGSLQQRNGFTIDQGLFLWFRYTAAAIINRPDLLVVEYERLLDEPESELRRTAAHIELDVAATAIAAAARSLRRAMAHHDAEPLPHTPIGEICGTFYELLRSGGDLDASPALATWSRLVTSLPWAGPSDREITLAQRATRRAEVEVERLRADAAKLRARVRRLEGELRIALAALDEAALSGVFDLLDSTSGGRA